VLVFAISPCNTWREYTARTHSRQVEDGEIDMEKPKAPSELFPDRLRAARKLRALEQAELAAKAGLPPTSISHFESGARKPSFDNLRRLAQALNVTADYLMGRADEPGISRASDQLYRDIQKLTDEDRELAQDFLALLANRKKIDGDKK
jgi:transcriptional regulator with XRE-family HTH domain